MGLVHTFASLLDNRFLIFHSVSYFHPKVNSCNFQTKIEGQIETQETDGFLFLRKRINFLNQRKIHGKLNASWKISSLAVNGQSFLVIDGYLLAIKSELISLTSKKIPM